LILRSIVFLLVVLSITAAMWAAYRSGQSRQPFLHFTAGPTVEKLEELGALVSTKVHVADILAGNDGGHWKGAWLIKGDALLAVDMRQAVIEQRDDVVQRASIRLPPPRVLHPRVDHEKTLTYSVEKTTWIPAVFLPAGQSDRLRDAAMQHAQSLVAQAAGSDGHLAEARLKTATLIKSFYQLVGWDVEVHWAE